MLFSVTVIVNDGETIAIPTIEADMIQQAMVIATDRIVGMDNTRIVKIEEF